MLAKPLSQHSSTISRSSDLHENKPDQYEITNRGYGKDSVKVLHVSRQGPVHTIQEYEVGIHLKLSSTKEYYEGINANVICSDSQKNTIYLLAKKHGIESPETFALLLAKHYLNTYSHVEEAHVHVEAYPWQRVCQDRNVLNQGNLSSTQDRQLHNHAFISTPTAQHYCDVIGRRYDANQTIISGIKGLKVLKTTQSSFVNFIKDEYRTLPDQHDRISCIVIDCSWEYSSTEKLNFLGDWQTVKNTLLENFAGEPNRGVSLPSVQHTVYLSGKKVMDALPQVSDVSITMLNKHYLNFDTKEFQQIAPGDNNEVFITLDEPYSSVFAQLSRKDINSSNEKEN